MAVVEAATHSVVSSEVAGEDFEAKDLNDVDSGVTVVVLALVEQLAGLHWVTVLPDCELEAPNSDSPATIVPLVSAIVFEPDVGA